MFLDPNNRIVKLCVEGANNEADSEAASSLFAKAWDEAINDRERLIAAHYIARHQNSIESKLKWDELALDFARKIEEMSVKVYYPSLYLNVAKGYEDLRKMELAKVNYNLANSFIKFLPEDGYGKMIRAGITSGIARISENENVRNAF